MIFVVLGTQDKPFDRLLTVIDDSIKRGIIKDEVIVQAGETEVISNNMIIEKMIPMDEFNGLIKRASLVICHAGYGILSTSLEYKKKVISAARLAEYGEHQNNHQKNILDYYEQKGYIKALRDFSKFDEIYLSMENFTPKEYNVSFEKLQKFLCDFIESDKK